MAANVMWRKHSVLYRRDQPAPDLSSGTIYCVVAAGGVAVRAAAFRSMGGADDCGAGDGAGRRGGVAAVAGGRRVEAGAAEPVVSFSGSVVMMLTGGIESADGKKTFGPGGRGAA